MVLVCLELGKHHSSQFWNTFITPKRNSRLKKKKKRNSRLTSAHSVFANFPITTKLPSVSMDLPILDISCKWNHSICSLLRWASFTMYNVFNVHLCWSMYKCFTLFMSRQHSIVWGTIICLCIHRWCSFGLFRLFLCYEQCYYEF